MNQTPKRILLIDIQNHNYAGGIETYTRNLMPVLRDLHCEIDEYSTCENIQRKVCEPFAYVRQIDVKRKNRLQELNLAAFDNNPFALMRNALREMRALRYQARQLETIASGYDLIICNQTVLTGLSRKMHPNIVWVQHNDFKTLKRIVAFARTLARLFLRQNFPYKAFSNQVVFSERSENLSKRLFRAGAARKTFFRVGLTAARGAAAHPWLEPGQIDAKRRGPIVVLGRAKDVRQKRTDIANRVAKWLDRPVCVYGEYDERLARKYKNLVFKGSYSAAGDLRKILDEAALVLIASDFEGMPYVGIEAISNMTPVAVRDTFAEARSLVKHGNGLLIAKTARPRQIAQRIAALLNDKERYEQTVVNNRMWESELDYETFAKGWRKVLKAVL